MVKIISDSTCDLSKDLLDRYDISIIPLHICLGEKEYRDGLEISPDEIYKWADEHRTTPKTSAPSLEDVENIMKPILENGDEIIVFTISSSMSTSYNVMKNAADDLGKSDKVTVVDSMNLSTGIGLSVVEAAILAKEGKDREEICEIIGKYIPRVRASFVVDTLVYLHRGGRCSTVAALAGSMLKLHPKIVVEDGKMFANKKYAGKIDTVILKYVQDMAQDLLNAKKERVFITHSGCDVNTIEMVKDYLKSLNHFDEILVTRAGGVISSHCGPGTLGVLFIQG